MKNRFFLSVVFSFIFMHAWSQSENNNTARLTTQCRQILELSEQIASLEDSLTHMTEQIETIRVEWEKICLEYIASDSQTKEDFDYLINHTDTVQDGKDLYLQLVEASKHVKTSDNPKPGTVVGRNLNPVSEQSPVKSEDEKVTTPEDKKKDERKEEKPVTPPAGKKGEDIGKDMKSVIGNKGKK